MLYVHTVHVTMIIPIDSENGVLRYVQGQAVAQGSSLLPDANSATQDTHSVEVDGGPSIGRVVLVYERMRNARFGTWFWACRRADPVNPEP